MSRRHYYKILPVILTVMMVMTACNVPGTGGNTDTEAQIQTMSAATVAAFISQSLTQTAQAEPVIVVVTSTPAPTTAPTNTPNIPAATATSTNAPTSTIIPTKTLVPVPCNAAQFVKDVTVDDGTSFIAGTAFTKTWRIRNVGSCTWSTDYELYFYGGNSMNGPKYVDMPKTVRPNETVDISVDLTAPGDPDTYNSKWMLRAANGAIFGVGTDGNAPLTVQIKVSKVPESKDPNIVYDFVKNYCKAAWKTNAGTISCPSSELNFKSGTIMRTYAPVLENGQVDDEGSIITIPAKGGDGMIQGQYPAITVHDGDHIAGALFCSYKMTDCSVTFEVLAREKGTSTTTSLGTWSKDYGESMIHIDIDLSAMDGKDMIFYLKVSNQGSSTDDYAQWMAIRITHP